MSNLYLTKEYMWPCHCSPSFYTRYICFWYDAAKQRCIIDVRGRDCYGGTPRIITNLDEVEIIYLFLGW